MESKNVRELEHEIEMALARAMERLEADDLPLRPTQATLHLMAKAAVTVYEAAVENQQPPKRGAQGRRR